MRERLLRPLGQCSKLHKLLVLFTLLLALPQTTWGEEVTKTITFNKTVSTVDSNIDNSTMSVSIKEEVGGVSTTYDGEITISNHGIKSYSCSANGALFKMNGYSAANSSFDIMIPGNYPAKPSRVIVKAAYANGDTDYYFGIGVDSDSGNTYDYKLTTSSSNDNVEAEFTADGSIRTNRDNEGPLWLDFVINATTEPQSEDVRTTITVKEISITYTRDVYGITVAGTSVKSDNVTDILGDGKVSYNATTNTLTLNGATIDYTTDDAIFSTNTSTLNIDLLGTNSISCGLHVAFNVSNNLNFQSSGATPGQLTITSTYDIDPQNYYTCSGTVTYQNSLVATNPTSTSVLIAASGPTDYGITVAGTAVTSANASNVLNDDYSSVSYNATTKTLTLKSVDLTSATNKNITATSAMTIHLVGYNNVGTIDVNDGNTTVAVKATTSETLPGYLKYTNMSGNFTWDYQNGLGGSTGGGKYIISSGSTNPYIIYASGSYDNGDISGYNNAGDQAYLDVSPDVAFVSSTNNTDIKYFKVSSSSQSCYIYPGNLDDMNLVTKAYLLFDWGTCTNKSVKVQVRGLTNNFITDGTYSDEVSLPSDGGLVEIPLNGTINSYYFQLYFSSSAGEFSFIPISVGFQKATSYGISVAGTEVTSANASRITGTGISGTVTYDASTNTLTLNGAGITSDYNALTYSGNTLLNIELNGTNSITATHGTYTINTTGSGNIKFVKATGASTAAELTVSSGDGSQYVFNGTNPSLGSGLYWKPIAGNQMVITEDPNFLILDGEVIPDGTTINGDNGNGSLKYNASDKILTLTGYTKDFGAQHAIKTGVSGLKVKLVGASTITCSADSAVFRAFSSSASIQFIKDDATSKLTMTGTAYSNFGSSSITYDGLFYYSDNTNKYITQAAAPALNRVIGYSSGYAYTFATIDYAASDKSGDNIKYATVNPALKYSFDYADPQKQDVSNQAYPDGGIQMTDPGILTTWVEIGTYKGPESKGVRFGLLENPIEMEFDGTAKQISITPAPTMTNPVTINVNSDSETNFNGFAVLDATNNKITINNCYKGQIGFTFSNIDGGYTSLNDSTNITFNVLPSKPTLSLESGLYYPGQQITATPTVPDAGYNSYFKINGANEAGYTQPYTYTFNSAGVFDVSTVTYYIRGGGLGQIFGEYVNAKIIINTKPILNAMVENTEPYVEGHGQVGDIYIDIRGDQNNSDPLVLQTGCKLYYYIGSNKNNAVEYDPTNHIRLTESNTVTAYIVYTDPADATIVYESEPVSASYIVNQQMADPFGANQNYKTYYLDEEYSMKKPDGLKVYVITGVSGNSVTTSTLDYIPSKKPVLLEKVGEAVNGYYNAETYTGAEADLSGNLLKRAQGEVNADNNTYYVLYNNEFVKAVGLILNHGHYLDLNSVNPSRGMYSIGDGSTGIRDLRIENGELREEWFDMQGRRIDKPTRPGLYIKNGKKVVVNNK